MAEEVLTFCKWKPGTKEARGLLSLLLLILGCAQFLLPGVEGSGEAWLKSEKHAEFGTEIQLPCILKLPQCIGLHSIKWYQGNERIFVYSAEGEMTLANDEVASRMKMVVPKNNMTKSYLKISNLTLEDEALYKCEVTYLAVNRECNTVQHITLNVTVQPTSVRVIDESTKQTLEDGRVLGPVIEGSPIALRCEGGKGRPVPTVEWYNGDVKLKSESSQELEEHEIGTGSGTLNLVVARSELGATFTCKVSSLALAEPLKIDIKLDVHVRPMKMDIKGVVGHVIQGSKVLLQCEVQGARPPANVTWYNGTDILEKNNSRLDMYETKLTDNDDGTTQTNSFLAFTASEHDNGRKFSCAAVNSVMLKEGSKPMTETVIMEVMYPPLVRMSPDNITVNETEDFQLFCDYEANPATLLSVIWQRDGKNLTLNDERYEGGTIELTSLLVKNATANDIGKYSCILENDFGISNSQEFIDVSVLFRPTVSITVEPDPPINEADRLNVSLSCNVKTGNPSYLTAVRWYLDGSLLKELPDCSLNTSTEELCDIDPSKLLLESVGRSFHGNYSCEGKNDAGWGPISSNTPVIVHFPPENLTVSPKRVNVTVDNIPPPIRCNATSRPDPSYRWEREGSTDHNNGFDGPVLKFKEPITRDKSGIYICQAFNRIGQATISTFIDVQYKPECRVDKEVMDGKDYVVCIADGNPAEYTFKWSLKSDNDTIEEKPVTINGRSYLLLDDSVSNPRTYVCVAKNVIDDSSPCERHVPASIPWWLRLDGDLLVIVIATTVIIILIIIVVCVIIFLMCRRKHSKLKYPSQAANSNHHMDSVSEGLSEPETKTFYENLPFHGIQSPPNKTNSIYDYKEHYQQQQEMQQYGYPLPSNSSSQLTLPLTRSLYHSSSVVSPLQTSYAHANSRHSLNNANLATSNHQQHYLQDHHGTSNTLPFSLLQHSQGNLADVPDLTYDRQQQYQQQQQQQQQQQSRRHSNTSSRSRNEKRKLRNKHERNELKKKSQQRQQQQQQQQHQLGLTSCETSFERVQQELGMPESYKISYPHYYEDALNECPVDYQQDCEANEYDVNSDTAAQQYQDQQHSLTKNRGKSMKSRSSRSSPIWTTLT